MQKKNRKCYQISHAQKQSDAARRPGSSEAHQREKIAEGGQATVRLATTVKKKIISHICQPSQKNTKRLEAATPHGPSVQTTHIQSAQQLASGFGQSPLLPISETLGSLLVARQLQNSRHCS
jgi:hypothetical protein